MYPDEPPVPAAPGTPEWLGQAIENQKNELAIRAQELELQKQQDNNNLQFAMDSLAAQLQDRGHERDSNRHRQKDRQRFVLGIILIVCALIFGALWLNKDAVALELTKDIGFLLAGAAGGYGIARSQAKSKDTPSQPDAN